MSPLLDGVCRRGPRHSGVRALVRRFHRRRKQVLGRLRRPLIRALSWIVPRSLMRDRQALYLWERRGIHVKRVHYYSPIPDTRQLGPEIWEQVSELVGLDLREAHQVELLERFRATYRAEYDQLPLERTEDPCQFSFANSSFRSVDAEILYCMIRDLEPARIIEIGSGHTTLLATQAIRENQRRGRPCELVAIEPFPDRFLRRAVERGLPGLSRILRQPVEGVPLAEFEKLSARDILFIDSTHVLRTGGDVRFEYLEVLPRLAPGVVVHVHDIFLPYEYPKEWILEDAQFFNEQYLLQAFLSFNDRFEVLWASQLMARRHPEELRDAFRSFAPGASRVAASFWMRRIR